MITRLKERESNNIIERLKLLSYKWLSWNQTQFLVYGNLAYQTFFLSMNSVDVCVLTGEVVRDFEFNFRLFCSIV